MTKPKICHVITRMDWGGSPEIVRLLCEGLAPDFDVTLVIGRTLHPSEKTAAFLDGFKGKVVVIPELQRDIHAAKDMAALVKLYRFFRGNRFDLVHTHTAKAGFLGRLAARLAGCRRICHTPHGHNFYGYFGKAMSRLVVLLERMSAAYTSRLVMLTELERADHLKFGICSAGKLVLIRSCLEMEFFQPAAISSQEMRKTLGLGQEKVVAMVSRLEQVKGPEFFVDACRRISAAFPAAMFLIVGEGSLRQGLHDRVRAYRLEKRFVFTGWREDVREIMGCVDALVLPSMNEALGLVLLQAQAVGVPVVASDVGGVAEAVRDGQTGVLVPAADAEAIARAVCRILADDSLARSMGDKGREWVGKGFVPAAMVARHKEMYSQLLEKR